jgi:AraC family transcriptional regulator of adaptative response/methylated-DNA-[protein]-cysteine methyltransferase
MSFLSADEDPKRAVEEMKAHWNRSLFHENIPVTSDFIEQIFAGKEKRKLHLFVKGTNFQVKVWEALLRIPEGHVTTYQQIAGAIKNDKAVQAVGSAVGSNHIALLIPCHRVIRKDGILGEYRWSSARKKSIIGWEMARNF